MTDYTSISQPFGDALKGLVGDAQGQARGVHLGRGVFHVPQQAGGRRYGKLDDDLDCNDPGAVATMSVWRWDPDTAADVDSGEDIEVCAPFAAGFGYVPAGRQIEAEWSSGANSYMIVAGGSFGWIEFTPTQAFATTDAAFSATIDAIHGKLPDAVEDEVTINNTKLAFSGDTSTLGIRAEYDPIADAYFCSMLGCPSP